MKHRLKQFLTTISTITLILLPQFSLIAQTTTPTPAPSKTPEPTSTPGQTTEPQQILQSTTAKTQSDLTTLTGNIQRPNGMVWHNNNLFVSCSGDWTIYEIDTNTSSTIQYIYGVRNAHSIYATEEDNETHLWIADFQSNTFIHIHRGITEVIASELQGPWGTTQLDQETFAVTNLNNNSVTSVKRDGTTKEILTGLRSPSGITSDENYIYIANTGSARRSIEWFPKSDTLTQQQPVNTTNTENQLLVTGLQNTTNITLATDGFLYFSYALGTRGVVGRIDPNTCREKGGCSSEEIQIVLYTELAAPLAGLTISPDMKLYIHSIFSPDLYWVQLDTITTP
jgi:hypothetical protein